MIPTILTWVVIIAIAAAWTIFSRRKDDRRRAELSALAARLGFDFNPNKDESFAMGWGFLTKLARGTGRYAFNILRGEADGQKVFIFDYRFETGSGENKEDHYCTCLMLIVHAVFPQLTIGPERLLSRISNALGREDINFESAEFSRKFCVRSKDKRFAYDVCKPKMIEYLLENRDLEIEFQGPVLLLCFEEQLPAARIECNLARLFEIRARLPEYLFTNA